ncbi:MAG: peptidase [Hyphomicrobiales bacterium]|nr:MAG: peptidase [Hyphomicrobiales bacterium]
MDANRLPLIFDGHNDILLRLYMMNETGAQRHFIEGRDNGHLDMPRIKEGGFGGGFFAIYVPSPAAKGDRYAQMRNPTYDLPLPDEIPVEEALGVTLAMVAILSRIERDSNGAAKICLTAADIRHCLETDTLAMLMHIEGAEAIDKDFNSLEVLHRAGLRSIGPVWSRPTKFGHGVPFRYPSTGDIGPGLTDLGKELIKAQNHFNMVIDLSHLNEAGFWDVAKLSDAPLVATHSNAYAICPHARNLTDKQLAAIRESEGMVGLNFACAFLRPDGQMRSDVTLDEMLRHLDHLIEHVGEDGVGIGTDFDGALVPEPIKDVVGFNVLRAAMRDHGYGEELMIKLCHGNWLRVLEKTLKG